MEEEQHSLWQQLIINTTTNNIEEEEAVIDTSTSTRENSAVTTTVIDNKNYNNKVLNNTSNINANAKKAYESSISYVANKQSDNNNYQQNNEKNTNSNVIITTNSNKLNANATTATTTTNGFRLNDTNSATATHNVNDKQEREKPLCKKQKLAAMDNMHSNDESNNTMKCEQIESITEDADAVAEEISPQLIATTTSEELSSNGHGYAHIAVPILPGARRSAYGNPTASSQSHPTPIVPAIKEEQAAQTTTKTEKSKKQESSLHKIIYNDYLFLPDPIKDMRRNRGGVIEAFPEKLHRMVTEASSHKYQSNVISFCSHGRAFNIHKPSIFVNEIMPMYFRQTRFTSFQRQLNLYGFQRITHGADNGGYFHELFLRGRFGLIVNMRRTKIKGKVKCKHDPESEPDFYKLSPCPWNTATISVGDNTATTTAYYQNNNAITHNPMHVEQQQPSDASNNATAILHAGHQQQQVILNNYRDNVQLQQQDASSPLVRATETTTSNATNQQTANVLTDKTAFCTV